MENCQEFVMYYKRDKLFVHLMFLHRINFFDKKTLLNKSDLFDRQRWQCNKQLSRALNHEISNDFYGRILWVETQLKSVDCGFNWLLICVSVIWDRHFVLIGVVKWKCWFTTKVCANNKIQPRERYDIDIYKAKLRKFTKTNLS